MTVRLARPSTPDQELPNGATRITVKRACNGCGYVLGDATTEELERAMTGQPIEDVRHECPRCTPVAQCTGLTARWCPRCGDCICPRPENGLGGDLADPQCPLHRSDSQHAEEEDRG